MVVDLLVGDGVSGGVGDGVRLFLFGLKFVSCPFDLMIRKRSF